MSSSSNKFSLPEIKLKTGPASLKSSNPSSGKFEKAKVMNTGDKLGCCFRRSSLTCRWAECPCGTTGLEVFESGGNWFGEWFTWESEWNTAKKKTGAVIYWMLWDGREFLRGRGNLRRGQRSRMKRSGEDVRDLDGIFDDGSGLSQLTWMAGIRTCKNLAAWGQRLSWRGEG
jgi:hypothetical protein